MESAALRIESNYNSESPERNVSELLALGEVASELEALKHSPDFPKTYNSQVEKIAQFLFDKRWEKQFDIPEFQGNISLYKEWDKKYAEEIANRWHTEEMEKIRPTPEKVLTRTNAERYSDLLVKAEAKAREYEQKMNLTPTEAKRLEEIRSDVLYFKDKLQNAIQKEQDGTEMLSVAENPKVAAVREELIQLNKPNKQEEPIENVIPETTPTSLTETLASSEEPKSEKVGFFKRIFGSKKPETAEAEYKPVLPKAKEAIVLSEEKYKEEKLKIFLKNNPTPKPFRNLKEVEKGLKI